MQFVVRSVTDTQHIDAIFFQRNAEPEIIGRKVRREADVVHGRSGLKLKVKSKPLKNLTPTPGGRKNVTVNALNNQGMSLCGTSPDDFNPIPALIPACLHVRIN
jgi:hypothetical protein